MIKQSEEPFLEGGQDFLLQQLMQVFCSCFH